MCTRYVSPEAGDMERAWQIGSRNPWRGGDVYPNHEGPFVRAARDSADRTRELVVGQWSLISWFAKERKLIHPTANARNEKMAGKATHDQPRAKG